MHAALIAAQGTPVHRNIRLDEWERPSPGPGEVLVRTEASALNHLDLWVGRGLPGLDLEYPRIGGSDGCGIVEEVGGGVDAAWIGRRVLLNAAVEQHRPTLPDVAPSPPEITMIGEHTHGTHAEFFTAPVEQVLALSEDVDPVEAAAFGLTFLTAWRCLVTRAGLEAGQWVLIPGIGGGVATAGLAIARHFGCRAIVTSRHQWKLDRARELGAEAGILDDGKDWSRRVREITGKRGVDVVLDSVGKAVHLACIKSLTRGGTLVTPGATTGPDPTTDLARIFWNQLQIVGSTMGDMTEYRPVVSLLEAGLLRPAIDRIFEPRDAASAWERLESGEQFGKIVLRWV